MEDNEVDGEEVARKMLARVQVDTDQNLARVRGWYQSLDPLTRERVRDAATKLQEATAMFLWPGIYVTADVSIGLDPNNIFSLANTVKLGPIDLVLGIKLWDEEMASGQ